MGWDALFKQMISLPKWLKKRAEAQRQMRLGQRRVSCEEARRQFERVAGPVKPARDALSISR